MALFLYSLVSQVLTLMFSAVQSLCDISHCDLEMFVVLIPGVTVNQIKQSFSTPNTPHDYLIHPLSCPLRSTIYDHHTTCPLFGLQHCYERKDKSNFDRIKLKRMFQRNEVETCFSPQERKTQKKCKLKS